MKRVLRSEADTASLARELAADLAARALQGGLTVGLIGGLGSGKTTFVRHLLAALGSREDVSSPSFVLEHEYRAGALLVRHWDLYRLSEAPPELLEPSAAHELRLVEWSDRAPELEGDLSITFEVTNHETGQRIATMSLRS